MALKAGRKQRNQQDARELRQAKGTRTSRRQGTKAGLRNRRAYGKRR